MGRSITKKMMVLVLLLHLLISSSSSGLAVKTPNANGEVERFSPYESQRKTPKSADSDSIFHGNTCCSAVKGYMGLFDLLECLICDLNVEIQSGHRVFDTYLSSNQTQIFGGLPLLEPEILVFLKFGLIFLRWSYYLLMLVVILRLARALTMDLNRNA